MPEPIPANELFESILGPRTLGEYIDGELESYRIASEIDEGNLREIKQGNQELLDIYGTVEFAEFLTENSRKQIKEYSSAQEALTSGDKTLARQLLENDLNNLSSLVNSNLAAAVKDGRDVMKEAKEGLAHTFLMRINSIRPLLNEQ